MNPQQGISRRQWLAATTTGLSLSQLGLTAQTASAAEKTKLGMPGLYPGRVVAVSHPGCISNGEFQTEPIRRMMHAGMLDLTEAPDVPSAWRLFFERGDVVGIKVNPVGSPHVISCPQVLRQIIEGLQSAGVRKEDIVVYDRYRAQFLKAGFREWLPEGVRWSSAAEDYDAIQQAIAGYDPDVYLDFPVTLPGYDINNAVARRSHPAKFITQEVNKLVNLAVLKDHQSAGVTLALKNLSHGLVNNVSRSHGSTSNNVCGAFIPAVVSLPVIRNKAVLHVLDGIKGLYHGGPSARPQFVWEHRTIYFATDPVALDHIGWKEIDKKRLAVGKKILVEDTPDRFSTFVHRQPEHIEIAGAMGLGVWDEKKIQRVDVALTA